MSTFDMLCVQATVQGAHRLYLWCDVLKADIVSKTEFDPITKLRFACMEDAPSAAVAVDSFYNPVGTAGCT